MPKVTRLYQLFQPEHYKVSIQPDAKKLTFVGSVEISGNLLPESTKLALHIKDLVVTSVLYNDQNLDYKIDSSHEELAISLPDKIKGNICLVIDFEGEITKPMHGLYPCIGRDGGIILATQFESHHAREVFPCIDEPEAKATFDLTIISPDKQIVLGNTPIKNSSSEGGTTTTEFERTPIMSTYLLAFTIGDVVAKEATTRDGVIVRAWATPDQANFTDFALDVAIKTLEFYNNYFEIPYPLDKCDMIALPDFASGAMENWGLITFRETCMLVDPANTSLATKQYVAMVVAHELAHQWFGNLVTMSWWTDLWLNEGFASWIEYMAIDEIFPEWNMWTQFIADEQQAALRLDALKNTHPIEVEVKHPDEIRTIFDTISYAKGSSVIHMLHAYLGAEDFRKGLVYYLKKYAYKNTVTTDLWDALSVVSGKPVAGFMSAWTSQPGFPLVIVKETPEGLSLKQEHFFANPAQRSGTQIWQVPLLSDDISIQTLSEKQATAKLTTKQTYKINMGQAGFYHTKYPKDHYPKLGVLVEKGMLAETDRLGLLADALALNKSGDLSLEQLLDLLTSYGAESSSPVWDIIATLIADIRRVMGSEVREALKPTIYGLTLKQVTRLGWDEDPNDSHFDKLLRPGILGLASGGDNESVNEHASKLFSSTDKIEDLPSNIRGVVLGFASRTGGAKEFEKILQMYRETISPEDKVILASSLTNFRNKIEFKKALKLIKTKDVRLQDVGYWLAYALMNPSCKDIAWNWVQDNWSWLEENLGDDMSFSRLPMYVARAKSDLEFLEEYEAFFNSVHSPSLDRAIKQGAETIRTQAAWRARDEQKLLAWLEKAL